MIEMTFRAYNPWVARAIQALPGWAVKGKDLRFAYGAVQKAYAMRVMIQAST